MMSFQKGFVGSILVNNKPLREFNYEGQRTVKVPFDSEYIIRLKNKNNVRAKVSVSIDGTNVLNGGKLILEPNDTFDLERFVDQMDKGSKFKFMSLVKGAVTGEIQDPYSNDNGLIEIKFEKEIYYQINASDLPTYGIQPSFFPDMPSTYFGSTVAINRSRGGSSMKTLSKCVSSNQTIMDLSIEETNSIDSTLGATAEGTKSDQAFAKSTDSFLTDPAEIITIKMVGQNFIQTKEYGVYLEDSNIPEIIRSRREECYDFCRINDFGTQSITIKEIY